MSETLLDKGNKTEAVIQAWLCRKYGDDNVLYVGDEKKRLDWQVGTQGGNLFFEGKRDERIAETRNIPWEVYRLRDGGMRLEVSWGYKTKSSTVVFHSPQWHHLFRMQVSDMRQWIWQHARWENGYKPLQMKPANSDGLIPRGEPKTTMNALVPVTEATEAGVVIAIPLFGADVEPWKAKRLYVAQPSW